jgi:Protein of unknown function (DUF2505)
MRISIEQAVEVPPARVMAAYGAPAFYAGRPVRDDIAVLEVVRHESAGGRTLIEVHFAFQGSVSAAVRRVIDPKKLSWVTRIQVFPDEERATWVVLPDHYPDRLTASGHYRFRTGDDGPQSTVVVVEGDLRVHVPIVGGTVERVIVAGLRRYFEAEVGDIPGLYGSVKRKP